MTNLFLSLNTPCGNKYAHLDLLVDISELTKREFVTLYGFLRALEQVETDLELKSLADYPEISRN
jgi:hypothetical protein